MLLVCEPIQQTSAAGKVNTKAPSVTAGLEARPAPTKPGLHLLTPAQVAGLRVEPVRVGREVSGYQRTLIVPHARAIARRLAEGEPMPPILYAVDDERDNGEIVDGQHRAAAAIIASTPIWAVCFEATPEERRRLFANQGKASKVNQNTLLLAGDQPWHAYLKAAVTDDHHPWYALVTTHGGRDHLSVAQAWRLIRSWVVGITHDGSVSDEILRERWNAARADVLAELLQAFGTKRSNPHAWSAIGLRAIVSTAVLAIDGPDTLDRWAARMPSFNFADYRWLRSSAQLSDHLLEHWNRGLRTANRVERRAA